MSFKTVNYLHDRYLDYKYTGYQYHHIDAPYRVTKIALLNPTAATPRLTLVPNSHNICVDLRHHKLQIKCLNVCQMMYDKYKFTAQTIIYIYFIYGEQEYIIPYQFSLDGVINLPIYTPDDMDTCMKTEYDSVETKTHKSEIMPLVNRYAGPKGNFYGDTIYRFAPRLMCDETGHMLLTQPDDYLKLVTMMGNEVTISDNQLIEIQNF